MSLCINPHCRHPNNSDIGLYCQFCGSILLLEALYRVRQQLGGSLGNLGETV